MGASHPVPDKWEPFQDRFSDSAPEMPPTFPFPYVSNRTLSIQFSIAGNVFAAKGRLSWLMKSILVQVLLKANTAL